MLIGIFLSSLGVSLSIKSGLGATPIGVCPAVFSPPLKISTGIGTGILLGLFFVVQIIILKREFRSIQFMQLLSTVIYAGFIDITTNILSVFPAGALWQRGIFCGLGIASLAFGVFTMLKVDFIMLPQDAMVKVITDKYNKDYGKIKIALDSMLTMIAIIGSLTLYNSFVQVGVGTIAGAIFVGKIISGLKKLVLVNDLIDKALGETQYISKGHGPYEQW